MIDRWHKKERELMPKCPTSKTNVNYHAYNDIIDRRILLMSGDIITKEKAIQRAGNAKPNSFWLMSQPRYARYTCSYDDAVFLYVYKSSNYKRSDIPHPSVTTLGDIVKLSRKVYKAANEIESKAITMSTLKVSSFMMDMSLYQQFTCIPKTLLLLGVAGFLIVGPILRVTIKSNNQFLIQKQNV
uniref:Uncharacterized protein n=1 Tax=Glossina brevipalpis TaxID=37001 RepID=A0A1A9W8D7_9MUSC